MHSKELRIGNLFTEKHSSQLIKVVGISDKSITFDGQFDHHWQAEPISITEDWLLKIGFMKQSSTIFFIAWRGRCHYVQFLYNEWVYYQFRELNQFDLKYIHQLQNIFYSLTQEELTIKQ